MSNLFDELNGLNNDGLDGLFSSIKKELSRANRKVKKINSKIADKILPNKIQEIGRKIDDNRDKIAIAAAGVGLAFVGGPAIITGLKGAAGIAAKGASLIKTGVSMAAKSAIGKEVVGVAKDQLVKNIGGQKEQEAAAAQAMQQKQAVAQSLANAMGQSQEFREAVERYRAEGYTDEQILQHWVESKSYYMAATKEAAQVIYPQVLTQVERMGYPHAQAQEIAYAESYRVADEEVTKIQQGASASKLIVPAIAAALLFMGN